jgi:iron(III) transport system ATP-binding protein
VGVMREGRIEQWAAPYDLYHRPATRFVAEFVGSGSFVAGRCRADGAIETALGTASAPQAADCPCAPGSAVDLLLRPDDIVHDDASPTTAEVVAKAFRGADFLYTLRLADGSQVLSLVPSHHDHHIGERIGVRLETDHVVAFEPCGGRDGQGRPAR